MRQELSISLSQRLAMTPELRQSIEILQMPAVELRAAIEKEFLENPLLEIEYLSAEPPRISVEKFSEPPDIVAPTLEEILMRQAVFIFNATELTAAKFLIGVLDKAGYLTISISEAAQILQMEEKFLEEILRRIQELEPAGVGARNLAECLRLQAERQKIYSGLVAALIDKHLPEIAERKIKNIARAEKVSIEKIRRAIEIIRKFNPKPGIAYGGEATKFIVPDVRIKKSNKTYEIILNAAQIPHLKISEAYSDFKNFDDEIKTYLGLHLNSAKQFIKSVRQREKTLLRVVEEIVRRQKDFLDKGWQFLKPMTMGELAESLNLHESTISRAVANKFVEIPLGVVELRKIFSANLSEENVTAAHVKALITELIKSENPKSPLSDQNIAEILSERGIKIARRTVMKYREQLGILSSTGRRK